MDKWFNLCRRSSAICSKSAFASSIRSMWSRFAAIFNRASQLYGESRAMVWYIAIESACRSLWLRMSPISSCATGNSVSNRSPIGRKHAAAPARVNGSAEAS